MSPTHQLPWLLESLRIARSQGLTLPLVYNTGGYERVEVLRQLEGIVDIYLPDFKFWSPELAWKYMRLRDYPEVARRALVEMVRQVGQLKLDDQGLAVSGLIVRHLVMPGMLDDAETIFQWIAATLGVGTCVSINPTYKPLYRASRYPEIDRETTAAEQESAMTLARRAGLTRLVSQRMSVVPNRVDIPRWRER